MTICKNCSKETKNKVYCSELCQHIGYKQNKVERVLLKCCNCTIDIYKIPSKIRKKNYCSKKCSDEHKKIFMCGANNHRYGKNQSEDFKKTMSEFMRKKWTDEEYKKKLIDSKQESMKNREYWFGNKPEEIERRRKKIIENYYGVSYEEYVSNIFLKRQHYYNLVWNITNKQPLQILENFNKRGRLDLKKDAYHLDHIIPIAYGFENNIDPEIIGDISNLQFIPAVENIKKGNIYEEIFDEKKNT